jgi:hypothetical protein
MRLRLSCLLLVVTSACGPRQLKVTMNPDNNSGQSGFAVLTDRGSKGIGVIVETSAPDFDGPQLAHIHKGNCGEVGEKIGFLDPLVSLAPGKPGRYGTTRDPLTSVTFEMLSQGEWALNVHDSRDSNIYVSCGEIPTP